MREVVGFTLNDLRTIQKAIGLLLAGSDDIGVAEYNKIQNLLDKKINPYITKIEGK